MLFAIKIKEVNLFFFYLKENKLYKPLKKLKKKFLWGKINFFNFILTKFLIPLKYCFYFSNLYICIIPYMEFLLKSIHNTFFCIQIYYIDIL